MENSKKEITQFSGMRPLDDVLKLFKKDGWTVHKKSYDQGGDNISFSKGNDRFYYNTFNGHFFGVMWINEKIVECTHMSLEYDEKDRYKKILNMVYLPVLFAKKSSLGVTGKTKKTD